jgi:hypothetical protein
MTGLILCRFFAKGRDSIPSLFASSGGSHRKSYKPIHKRGCPYKGGGFNPTPLTLLLNFIIVAGDLIKCKNFLFAFSKHTPLGYCLATAGVYSSTSCPHIAPTTGSFIICQRHIQSKLSTQTIMIQRGQVVEVCALIDLSTLPIDFQDPQKSFTLFPFFEITLLAYGSQRADQCTTESRYSIMASILPSLSAIISINLHAASMMLVCLCIPYTCP